jgi:hypothetical protein
MIGRIGWGALSPSVVVGAVISGLWPAQSSLTWWAGAAPAAATVYNKTLPGVSFFPSREAAQTTINRMNS